VKSRNFLRSIFGAVGGLIAYEMGLTKTGLNAKCKGLSVADVQKAKVMLEMMAYPLFLTDGKGCIIGFAHDNAKKDEFLWVDCTPYYHGDYVDTPEGKMINTG
jgi:hypothetical protein